MGRATGPLAAYLVKGEDPVLRAEAVRTLIGELVGDADPTLVVEEHEPEGDPPDTAALADGARTPPFLADRRVLVVREVDAYPAAGLGPLLDYLADPLPTTSIVLSGGRSPGAKLVNAVKKVGHVVEAGAPTNKRGRQSWMASHLEGAPVRLAPAALALVETHLGEDLGRLANLLETLAAAYGKGARVDVEDVRPFLGEAGAVPPWALSDAIDGGDTALALATLHRLLAAGDRHPLQIMASLHWHYARMLRLEGAGIADEATAAAALGLKGSTFPARKALDGVRRLGGEGVKDAFALLAQADLDLRGASEWRDDLVLEVLVARLSRLVRARR